MAKTINSLWIVKSKKTRKITSRNKNRKGDKELISKGVRNLTVTSVTSEDIGLKNHVIESNLLFIYLYTNLDKIDLFFIFCYK